MSDERSDRHIRLPLKRGARTMIVISPVETLARVEPIGSPRAPHPTDRDTIFDTVRRGAAEIRTEISERKLPTLAGWGLCVFSHHFAFVVRSRRGDDVVMLLGPGWWQIVRRRDGVPTSITTRTGDATPALAAELASSRTPVTVIGERPSLPVGTGTVIWYPYTAFAGHRELRRLNLIHSTRRSVRRVQTVAAIATAWFVVSTAFGVVSAPESHARAGFPRRLDVSDSSDTAPVADVPVGPVVSGSTVAQDLMELVRALSGHLAAERIEFGGGVFLATGILTHSSPAEIDRSGLEIRRLETSDAATRVVVAMTRKPPAAGAHADQPTTPRDPVDPGHDVPLSTMIRSIAVSLDLRITALRHVYDEELVVTFLGAPEKLLTAVFLTDQVARIVRLTIEPTGDTVQLLCVVAQGGTRAR